MKRVRLLRTTAIGEFANAVYTYRERIYRLWLISPWIGMYTDGRVDPLQLMIDAIRSRPSCMVTVITREPKPNADWHRNALRILKANVRPSLFFCRSLHTKLYIIESDVLTCAMLGSPNLTAGGNTENVELALEVRGTSLVRRDEISTTLCDLVEYARALLADEAVSLAP
jgi:phospholipase D-like protein